MPTITPCLWFDGNAEEAVKLYTSVFKNSKVHTVTRYGEAGHEIHGQAPGTVMTIAFELDGMKFTALNGGPYFKFNEAVSFQVDCKSQEEVDYYWDRLAEGGDKNAQRCGWLKDKFGLSWQIVPTALMEMLQDKDARKVQRVTNAMLQMNKLDIPALRRAFEQEP
jgi:predicted 3-demethylubiquinone-9 3-methyltransferase (glyoxalase superfamily)